MWVIQTRKSINLLLPRKFLDKELISLNFVKFKTSSETSDSVVGSVPENLQNSSDVSRNSEIHTLSESSRISYVSINEQRSTTEFSNMFLEQTKEEAKRRLERLQWFFELERQ